MNILIEAPTVDDVCSVAEDVWLALLGEDELLAPRALPPGSPFDAAGVWSATVSVSGAWQGVVTVELDDQVARQLTARMLAIAAPDEADDSDVADAVGELVNMIGGNIKSFMPGPSALSLPSVAAGRAAFATGVGEVCLVDLAWRGGPVRISIHVPQGAGR